MTLRFGTDGVRGVANAELTPELLLALGRAAARVLGPGPFLVGRDTRWSGPMVLAALAGGLASEGSDVVDLGVLPTPGVAWYSVAENLPAAAVSASHNSFEDNGVKFFTPGGRKLSDATETRLEAELDQLLGGGGALARPTGAEVGRIGARADTTPYLDALVGTLDGRRLDGLRVVLDCANGAASAVAPAIFRALGADVEVLHAEPDGRNINEGCGSTHPQPLQATVVRLGADAGFAFDGDADRVLAVDHAGALVDGDQLIAICAVDRQARGLLPEDTVVVTVMANLGFRQAMAERGIRVVDTKVGDRYVLEALENGGWALGGEQSGHIIFRDLATTGDGVLTGVQVLDVMARTGRPLAHLASVMTRRPQVLRNLRVASRQLDGADALWAEVRAVEERLGDRGRVLIRPSGTEAVIRVMVEAESSEDAEAASDVLADAVVRALGPGAGSVPERRAGSVPERRAGSVPERGAGSVPERRDGSVPERHDGSVSERHGGGPAVS
ncbi:MAG: phosphoglucosamine mutase [Actinomycetota bacterium]|nr:phosphoglucosamine mutase [Actinomycetota bacterium]